MMKMVIMSQFVVALMSQFVVVLMSQRCLRADVSFMSQ